MIDCRGGQALGASHCCPDALSDAGVPPKSIKNPYGIEIQLTHDSTDKKPEKKKIKTTTTD